MVEIYKNLYIGSQYDYEGLTDKKSYFIVQACKEPYHREALGYSGKGAPKTHSEYYFAYRHNRLICNLVDALNPSFIPDIIIKEVLQFIHNHLQNGSKVLVHCNQGMSRSAVIGLMFLNRIGVYSGSFEESEKQYLRIYPMYNPASGMRMYAYANWNKFL